MGHQFSNFVPEFFSGADPGDTSKAIAWYRHYYRQCYQHGKKI